MNPLLVLFLLLIISVDKIHSEQIVVHVIPHSHDDAGWLWTFDEYFYGNNTTKCVKCILDGTLESLLSDPRRTFVEVEIAFFSKWYMTLSEQKKSLVKNLVESGRWEFANAGWVMHDEATTYYQHFIDNMRLGLQFIQREFNKTVETAWFIDPFGHSSSNAAVLSKMGFKNMVLVRIDFKEKALMRKNREMEFIWKPFYDLDKGATSIFTHVMYDHYNANNVFPGYVDDVLLNKTDEEIYLEVSNIIKWAKKERSAYLTNNVLLLFGDDFTHMLPYNNFKNIERIIEYFNNHKVYSDQVKFIYSTPSKYFNDVKAYDTTFPEYKNIDFFPYADNSFAYWTGYFTSRPYLKGLVRDAGRYLYSSSRLLFEQYLKDIQLNPLKSVGKNEELLNELLSVRGDLGICQHHDAVAGTSKEYVANDYIERLDLSIKKARDVIQTTMNNIDEKFKALQALNSDNIQICIPSVSDFVCLDKIYEVETNKDLYLIIVNPGVNENIYPISIAVYHSFIQVLLIDDNKQEKEIEADIFCQDDHVDKCTVNFNINMEKDILTRNIILRKSTTDNQASGVNIDLETIKLIDTPTSLLTFDFYTGFTLSNYENSLYKFNITHGYLPNEKSDEIRPFDSNESGAYIMAPSQLHVNRYLPIRSISQIHYGKNIIEICLRYLHSTLKIKINKNKEFDGLIEVESIINPKDFTPTGMEFFLVIDSNIDNGIYINNTNFQPEFWTDENGMKMMRRIRDFRRNFNYTKDELVADNFYPVNYAISIRKKDFNVYDPLETDYDKLGMDDPMITVFNDRSQSGGALELGQILLDLNRWSEGSDGRGLPETIREGPSSDRYFTVKNFILFNNSDKKNLVYNILQKRPVIASVSLGGNSKETSEFVLSNILKRFGNSKSYISRFINFKNSNDCLEIDFYHLDSNRTVIQLFNKNDPYFNQSFSCEFKFNSEIIPSNYEIYEVSLNTLIRKTSQKREIEKARFLKHTVNEQYYSVKPQDFITFIIESYNGN